MDMSKLKVGDRYTKVKKTLENYDFPYFKSPKGRFLVMKIGFPHNSKGLLDLGIKYGGKYQVNPDTKIPYIEEGFDN